MTITEFLRLIETFGADRMRWPADQRGAAMALLAVSAEARAALERAAALDARLHAGMLDVPSFRQARVVDAALARIDSATGQRPANDWYRPWIAAFIPPAPASLVLLALIGCLLGLRVPLPTPPPSEPLVADLTVLLTGDTDQPL